MQNKKRGFHLEINILCLIFENSIGVSLENNNENTNLFRLTIHKKTLEIKKVYIK